MPHEVAGDNIASASAPPNKQSDNKNREAHHSNSSRPPCRDKGEGWREGGNSRSSKKEELGETTTKRWHLPLPLAVMSQVLIYADGATLTEALSVSKAFRGVVSVEHWETAARPARWLQSPAPAAESFESAAQTTSYWKRWSKLADSRHQGLPSGQMVVLGGSDDSNVYTPAISSRTEAFLDLRWGDTMEWKAMPRLTAPRCAAGAAVDRWGRLYMLGGWDTEGAKDGCECLDHAEAAIAKTASHASKRRNLGGGGLVDRSFRSDGRGATVASGGVSDGAAAARPSRRDQPEDDGRLLPPAGTAFGSGGSGSQSTAAAAVATASMDNLVSSTALAGDQPERERGSAARADQEAGARAWAWKGLPPLQQRRCFLGAAFDPRGGLLAIGGGTGMYTSDSAFETVEVLPPDREKWLPGPSMSEPRCGLGVAAMPDGKVYVTGGYAGNLVYLNSAEVLDPYSDRWTTLAPMRGKRAGVALASGPDGRLYAVGGSADGSRGHSSVERFDPREGTWGTCPPMIFGRAWCCAAFGASGYLYVLGGMSHPTGPLRTVEVFDIRSERWRVEDSFGGTGGRAIADACLVFQF